MKYQVILVAFLMASREISAKCDCFYRDNSVGVELPTEKITYEIENKNPYQVVCTQCTYITDEEDVTTLEILFLLSKYKANSKTEIESNTCTFTQKFDADKKKDSKQFNSGKLTFFASCKTPSENDNSSFKIKAIVARSERVTLEQKIQKSFEETASKNQVLDGDLSRGMGRFPPSITITLKSGMIS